MRRAILLILAPVAALSAPALSQAPSAPPATPSGEARPLSLEHRMLLRCSAAFALVAHGQEAGDEAALAYPPMRERGQTFFVHSSAKVIDEAGLDRSRLTAALTEQALELREGEALAQVMPACLSALEAAGL